MGPLGFQLIGMALGQVLQNAGDDANNNGMIQHVINKVAKSASKKLDASKEIDKVASKDNSLKLF